MGSLINDEKLNELDKRIFQATKKQISDEIDELGDFGKITKSLGIEISPQGQRIQFQLIATNLESDFIGEFDTIIEFPAIIKSSK